MTAPLFAIVGDITPARAPNLDPPLLDPAKARKAAEDLGKELAQQGARLLVYGGPFLEADVVRGFVSGNPKEDKSIQMWYTQSKVPPDFPEEAAHPKLFDRRAEKGTDWEVAFYRALTRADGIILMGGGNATMISGQVAIGARMPILAFSKFGGGASKVWDTLSAGEDLPTREEIDLMAKPWDKKTSAPDCVKALMNQLARRQFAEGAPKPIQTVLAGLLFLVALAIVPWIWGKNELAVWLLLIAPLLAGGAGAAIRPIADRQRGISTAAQAVLATIVLGLVAGGIAGVLFITAQLTGDPKLTDSDLAQYARRSIPYALAIGFIAGLTLDAIFSKLLGLDVVRTAGVTTTPPRT